jgi:hypothetical protein
MAADFFVVPTATGRLLFVLVMLAHQRRQRPCDRGRDGHYRGAHRAAVAVAKRRDRAVYWIRTPRVPRSRDHLDGRRLTASVDTLRRILRTLTDTFGAGQRHARLAANLNICRRQNHRHSPGGRPSPSIRAHRRIACFASPATRCQGDRSAQHVATFGRIFRRQPSLPTVDRHLLTGGRPTDARELTSEFSGRTRLQRRFRTR